MQAYSYKVYFHRVPSDNRIKYRKNAKGVTGQKYVAGGPKLLNYSTNGKGFHFRCLKKQSQ